MRSILKVLCVIPFVYAGGTALASEANLLTFLGSSDASTAVAIDKERFLVADDENNTLRLYKMRDASLPTDTHDLTDFLAVDPERPESDIEGSARAGNRVYWITSHGRNKDGKLRASRYRFFATELRTRKGSAEIVPVGTPCRTLAHDLARSPAGQRFNLDAVTRLAPFSTSQISNIQDAEQSKKKRKKLAPKEEGLNIEGLCASPDGRRLFIGLRNPRPKIGGEPHALLIPLENPAEVIDQGARPRFGKAMAWDLGGLGIRSIEYSPAHKAYAIVAGARDGDSRFALYRWDGAPESQPTLVRALDLESRGLNPEAILLFAGSPRLFLLSDDGAREVQIAGPSECVEGELLAGNKCLNKHVLNPQKQTFRGFWVDF